MIARYGKIITREIWLLFKNPQLFFLRRGGCFVGNSLLGIQKDLHFSYEKGKTITFPNNLGVSYVLMETFVYEIFSQMKGLQRVLDIGGFLGESAIYLSKFNTEVHCYELSAKNFSYLKKNCEGVKNISCHHTAVTTTHDEYVEYLEESGVDSTVKIASGSSQKMIKVKNSNIVDLLTQTKFDGFKLDIEGGEYEILAHLLQTDLFTFTKGIIEFHDLNLPTNFSFLQKFISFLSQKGYKYGLITNENRKIEESDLHTHIFCNIYFALA